MEEEISSREPGLSENISKTSERISQKSTMKDVLLRKLPHFRFIRGKKKIGNLVHCRLKTTLLFQYDSQCK